jgi:carboxymethylenebutenolidase
LGPEAVLVSYVTIVTPHRTLSGHLAAPSTGGPWPGVIVIHDVFGMTDDLRRQADWLAAAGYLTLAPDFFSWGKKLPCLVRTMREFQARRGRVFDDIDATRAWLAGRGNCNGRIGIIGFCMGGGFALLMAAGHAFAVSSVNYGDVPPDAATILQGACPVVGSFGVKDRALRGAAARLDQALQTNAVEHDVREYAEATHGFMNAHRGVLPAILKTFDMAAYHESSTIDARQRILAFFARHLANVASQIG